ncbi:hypothetical protein GCM10007939_08370 [Amylibacter marinus]|uniref:Sulfatase N-terminal domain-containing protein n=1 Tax=Amylibacter marinus TaxID=1475483 RepID=A0ABQ5VTA2_9RHOB|nr:sulfatase-like hydrolase/transferase [Amylibacter marinus]GLQ34554.1 hypothetical protein GCM10007939_08370 [Amylibacter marinus]
MKPPRILYTGLYILAFAISFIALVLSATSYTSAQTSDETHYIYIAFGVIFVALLVLPGQDIPRGMTKSLWVLALFILLSIPFAVLKNALAINRIDAILIFMRDHDLSDVASFGWETVFKPIRTFLFLGFIAFISAYIVQPRKKYFNGTVLGLVLLGACTSPPVNYLWETAFPSKFKSTFDLAGEIAGLDITAKPAHQRNMVIFYLESIEQSYKTLPQTAKAYQPLADFADQNTQFSEQLQVTGADITIAGILASHCGVPFLTKVSNRYRFKQTSKTEVAEFMPSVWCLGDQLQADGYTLSYMNGASLQKFSKGAFLRSHGYTRVMGRETLDEQGVDYRKNYFGADDEFLFQALKTEYETLNAAGKPFVLSMLTTATHSPDGFFDATCMPEDDVVSNIPKGISCSVARTLAAIAHMRALPGGDDTIFVVLSDHLSYKNTLYPDLGNMGDQRRNMLTIADGTAARRIAKTGTHLDIYPTLLETLGYQLRDHRANMGISLFSDTPTLIEQHGQDKINKLFRNNAAMADYLWR